MSNLKDKLIRLGSIHPDMKEDLNTLINALPPESSLLKGLNIGCFDPLDGMGSLQLSKASITTEEIVRRASSVLDLEWEDYPGSQTITGELNGEPGLRIMLRVSTNKKTGLLRADVEYVHMNPEKPLLTREGPDCIEEAMKAVPSEMFKEYEWRSKGMLKSMVKIRELYPHLLE